MPQHQITAEFRALQRYYRQDMFCCTIEVAPRYLARHPEDWIALLYYASALCEMARYTEALVALRKATRWCHPKRLYLVYYNYGHLYKKRGDLGPAERWYRRAVELAPSDATAHIFLGAVLARAGRLEEAEVVLRQAIRCEKGCIEEALHNLGAIVCGLGRYSEAREYFQRALVIDPKYKAPREGLADVEQVIAQLSKT